MKVSFKQQISHICRAAYCELRKISSVRHYLSTEATKILVSSFVLSRIDYGNALLAGLPKNLLEKLQRVQNSAARVISRTRQRDHITPVLKSLHWLPVQSRIEYKLASNCFSFFSGTGPRYFSDILETYTPSRELRSSSDNRLLRLPTVRTKSFGQRAFSFQGPSVWNNIPFLVRHSSTSHSFKKGLKTFLFQQNFDSVPILH